MRSALLIFLMASPVWAQGADAPSAWLQSCRAAATLQRIPEQARHDCSATILTYGHHLTAPRACYDDLDQFASAQARALMEGLENRLAEISSLPPLVRRSLERVKDVEQLFPCKGGAEAGCNAYQSLTRLQLSQALDASLTRLEAQ